MFSFLLEVGVQSVTSVCVKGQLLGLVNSKGISNLISISKYDQTAKQPNRRPGGFAFSTEENQNSLKLRMLGIGLRAL